MEPRRVEELQRPLALSLDELREVLLAYEVNGRPLPPQHGFPLRLLAPGWHGMANVKWLAVIVVTDRVAPARTVYSASPSRWPTTARGAEGHLPAARRRAHRPSAPIAAGSGPDAASGPSARPRMVAATSGNSSTDSRPAPIRAALVAGLMTPSSTCLLYTSPSPRD